MLAAVGIISKFIGVLYRVPLTNIVGAEGMGLYQTVFPVYTVLLAICGGGMTNAVTRVCAKYTAHGDAGSARLSMRAALVPLTVVSVIATAIVMLSCRVLSRIQGNADVWICYLALAPSLLFTGVIDVLRGYFQGRKNMMPSAVSQLIEQAVKLGLGLGLGRYFIRFGVAYAVAGALAGVTLSETAALIFLVVRYALGRKKRRTDKTVRSAVYAEAAAEAVETVPLKELRRELFSFALPVTVGALIMPIAQLIDSVLIVNLLVRGGAARGYATSLFGIAVGPVGTLINMPSVVVSSISVAFFPSLTSEIERGGDGRRLISDATKWIMTVVIPATVVFILFPQRICALLYSRGLSAAELDTAAALLRVQAVSVIYSGAFSLATAVLQAHGFARSPVVCLAIGAAAKAALTPLLVAFAGIYGAAAATVALYALASTLALKKVNGLRTIGASVKEALVFPAAFSAMGAAVAIGIMSLASTVGASYLLQSIIGGAAFVCVYAAAIVFPFISRRREQKSVKKTPI